MEYQVAILLIAFLTSQIVLTYGKEFYTIVAPGYYIPGSKYYMSFATTGLNKAMDVNVSFAQALNRQVRIKANAVTIVGFETNDFPANNCSLTIKSLNGISFEQSATLYANSKRYAVLIQTDKARYKPGDTIQFRIFVMDSETKPVPATAEVKFNVWIENPNKIKVKQWDEIYLVNGVFKNDLKLSNEPALGNWTLFFQLETNAEDEEAHKEIHSKILEVPDYNLPKFETVPSFPVINTAASKRLIFALEAKYTNGKNVKGTAVLRNDKLKKSFNIDGKAIVEFDVKDLKKPDAVEYFAFDCKVTEESTGFTEYSKFTVRVYNEEYSTKIITDFKRFRPGLPFDIQVKVARSDGKPVIDTANPVTVSVSYGFVGTNKTSYILKLNSQGAARLSVTVPLSTQKLGFEVNYREQKNDLILLPEPSESNVYIQANVLTKRLNILKNFRVQVRSTEPMKYLHYQVIGKYGVLAANQVNPRNSKIAHFKFWASVSMAPEAVLVVYYYRPSGEIVSDVVKFKPKKRLDNFANVRLSARQLEPGQSIDINVSAMCNSYVAVLGVDTTENLDKKSVSDELREFSRTRGSYPSFPVLPLFSQDFLPTYKRLVDAGGIFFTNAKAFKLRRSDQFKVGEITDNSETQDNSSVTNLLMSVRKDIPETWIWEDFEDNECQTLEIRKQVPDTITSWTISAISFNKKNGLGFSERPRSLMVSKPFYVSVSLPYSMRLGEVLSLTIQVFSYLAQGQQVTIEMLNEAKQFQFADDGEDKQVEIVTVDANSSATVTFIVTPLHVGYLPIKITARCDMAGDNVDQLLLVEHEGTPIYVNKAVLLDLRSNTSSIFDFAIAPPSVAVPDSTSATVTVFGDLLGNTIENLESLIRVPFGYAEQNMVTFIPNLLVLKYLKAVDKLTPALESRLIANLEIGYQRQLNYLAKEGYFLLYGYDHFFLTAYVVRYLAEASAYIKIDQTVLDRATEWLLSGKGTDAEEEIRYQFDSSDNGEGAYLLLALLAQPKAVAERRDYIKKLTAGVARDRYKPELYGLAVRTYALQKVGHENTEYFIEKLDQLKKEKNGLAWWEYKKPASQGWWSDEESMNIEITAIMLAIYAESGRIEDGIPVMNWLIKQRNSRGGYFGSQDTVLSIQALTLMAEKLYAKNTDIDVEINYGADERFHLKIDHSNENVVHHHELPLNTKSIQFNCTGTGLAVAQVSYKYHVLVSEPEPGFSLQVTIANTSTVENLDLDICFDFIAKRGVYYSNMPTVEVGLPSGYVFDSSFLSILRRNSRLYRVETANSDTLLIMHPNLNRRSFCLNLQAVKLANIANLKPTSVRIYDYYNNDYHARKTYDFSKYLQLQPSGDVKRRPQKFPGGYWNRAYW